MKLNTHHIAKSLLGLAALLLIAGPQSLGLWAPGLWAQDALPETPEGLENFRLDSPVAIPDVPPSNPAPAQEPADAPSPPAASVQPEPTPAASPPAAAAGSSGNDSTGGANSSSNRRNAERNNTAGQQASRSSEGPTNAANKLSSSPARETVAAEQGEPKQDVIPDILADTNLPAGTSAPQKADGDATGATPTNDEPNIQSWLIAAGGVGAAILLLLLFGFIKRRSAKSDDESSGEGEDYDGPAPNEPKDSDAATGTPAAPAARVKATADDSGAADDHGGNISNPATQPKLEIEFTPKTASLSFARLTVVGNLQVTNQGEFAARNVHLHSGIICACPEQERLLATFFAELDSPDIKSLDNIEKGERVTISIETSMPIGEVKSFEFDGRKICVPIMVAQLTYNGPHDSNKWDEQLAVMVGHEAEPPTEKIGPLRLDLGPRSFERLGARTVARP